MNVGELKSILNQFADKDIVSIEIDYKMSEIESIEEEIPEPLSMFDEAIRYCKLIPKDYDNRI